MRRPWGQGRRRVCSLRSPWPGRPRLHRCTRQLEATASGSAPAAEFVVVDLITQHDVEPDEQTPGQPPPSLWGGRVAGGQRSRCATVGESEPRPARRECA
jgi:hypothetical protein